MFLLGLSQYNYYRNTDNLPDNFIDRSVINDVHLLLSTVSQHSLFLEVQLAIRKSNLLSNISFTKYSSDDYLLLNSALSSYDCSSLYNVPLLIQLLTYSLLL